MSPWKTACSNDLHFDFTCLPGWLQNQVAQELLPPGSLGQRTVPGQSQRPGPAVPRAFSLHAFPDCRFRLDYALSREQQNKKGGKMYIQDKVEEYADEVFDLLDNGAHIYFCGLKGMMPGGAGALQSSSESSMRWGGLRAVQTGSGRVWQQGMLVGPGCQCWYAAASQECGKSTPADCHALLLCKMQPILSPRLLS